MAEQPTEYEILYSLRRLEPDGEFVEFGFGASSARTSLGACLDSISSDIQNYQWEREPQHPSRSEVIAEMERPRD